MSIEAMKLMLKALDVATTPLARDRQEVLRAQEAGRAAIEEAEKQEPVAWMHDSHVGFNVPLYTAPPKKEWVSLTDEEAKRVLYDIKVKTMGIITTEDMVRAIEAKLKDKNT